MAARIRNLSTVIEALRREARRKSAKFEAGLKLSGAYLLAQSQTIVPVDYGVLHNSGFVRMEKTGKGSVCIVGYTASYAVYVHEDLEKAHGHKFNLKYMAELAHARLLRKARKGGTTGPFRHSRGEDQQAKFLEVPFRRGVSEGTFVKIMIGQM